MRGRRKEPTIQARFYGKQGVGAFRDVLPSSGWYKGDNMKFLVCRTDALRPRGYMKSSEYFPMVVDSPEYADAEQIVKKALDTISPGYVGMHSYIVVPLTNAKVVSFKKRQEYDIDVQPYCSR